MEKRDDKHSREKDYHGQSLRGRRADKRSGCGWSQAEGTGQEARRDAEGNEGGDVTLE